MSQDHTWQGPVGNVPDVPVGAPAAGTGKRSIPMPRSGLHRPGAARSAWERAPDIVASWRWPGRPVTLPTSACSPVRSGDHGDHRRRPPVGPTAGGCGRSDPAFGPPAFTLAPRHTASSTSSSACCRASWSCRRPPKSPANPGFVKTSRTLLPKARPLPEPPPVSLPHSSSVVVSCWSASAWIR